MTKITMFEGLQVPPANDLFDRREATTAVQCCIMTSRFDCKCRCETCLFEGERTEGGTYLSVHPEAFSRWKQLQQTKSPHTCKFCGAPSWLEPSEQVAPPDYCQESDHGEPPIHQYYYKQDGCPANSAMDSNCICWHDEGTGMYKDKRYAQHGSGDIQWRLKPGA